MATYNIFNMSSMSLALLDSYIVVTAVFIAYASRPYLFSSYSSIKGNASPPSRNTGRSPLVTVVVPVYNEANVIDRIMEKCTSFNYDNYEIIVVDDSNDGTTKKLEKWADRIKLVHRESRRGWKGGAINDSLKYFSKDSVYTVILDADSLPESDLLSRLVTKIEMGYDVVQGVQSPDLNAGYNRIARAVAVTQGYYQFIEQPSKGMMGLPVTITGSNFIIKTELLKKFKFAEDIGEDWDLTLRLLSAGHKIVYDPTIITKCESPYTMNEAVKQYVRWSEGMVRATVKHFKKIIKSDMSFVSKLDIIMVGFSPLIMLFFIISTAIGAYLAFNDPSFIMVLILLSAFTLISGLVTMMASALKMRINLLISILSETLYFIFIPFSIYASIRALSFRKGSFNRTTKLGYTS